MKLYRLIILGIVFFIIFYYNFLYNSKEDDDNTFVEIPGCTNPDSDKYNPLANVDDGSCPVRCCDKENEDPCLCRRKNNGTENLCDLNLSKNSKKININQIKLKGLPRDIKFNELIHSAYFEDYFSKLMEISQITYMDYWGTNLNQNINVQANNSPEMLFFLAIEYIKRSEYDKAYDSLQKFIGTPNIYRDESCVFFQYTGCCQKDIDWIKNEDHKSYQIAKIIYNIILRIEFGDIDINFLDKQINLLKDFDKTPQVIDLIENIIFSILVSIKNNDESVIAYKRDFFENQISKYKYIEMGALLEPFDEIIGENHLSSQINISAMLKFVEAKKHIKHLINNHYFNSLYDIEALLRYAYIEHKYFGELTYDIKNMIDAEKKNIDIKYQEYRNKLVSKQTNNTSDKMDEDDWLTEYVVEDSKENIQKYIDELDTYCNQVRADDIISDWEVFVKGKKYSSQQSDSTALFVMIRDDIIDYNYFIESIDTIVEKQKYPIFKEEKKQEISNIINSDYYKSAKKRYVSGSYYIDGDPNNKYKIYKSDVYAIQWFEYLLNLKGPGMARYMKGDIKDTFKRDRNRRNDIDWGHELLISSISTWQQAFKLK